MRAEPQGEAIFSTPLMSTVLSASQSKVLCPVTTELLNMNSTRGVSLGNGTSLDQSDRADSSVTVLNLDFGDTTCMVLPVLLHFCHLP